MYDIDPTEAFHPLTATQILNSNHKCKSYALNVNSKPQAPYKKVSIPLDRRERKDGEKGERAAYIDTERERDDGERGWRDTHTDRERGRGWGEGRETHTEKHRHT